MRPRLVHPVTEGSGQVLPNSFENLPPLQSNHEQNLPKTRHFGVQFVLRFHALRASGLLFS
jgi:hypothetical protein